MFASNSPTIDKMVTLAQTIADIKSLKIQGATNIAKAGLQALLEIPDSEINQAIAELILVRPTEPLLQNCLELVHQRGKSVIKLLITQLGNIEEEIVKNGLPFINNGSIILTHCHSSTVVNLLRMAKKKGLGFKVYLTETRPKMQGRITAEELTEAGIDSTMITDSEAAFLVSKEDKRKVDLVLLGADAVFKDGSIFNKVGSYGISLAAQKAQIPVYILATLLKFSVKKIVIEERKAQEIWQDKPKKLTIFNPAFDKIPVELITAYVTEFGIIKPEKVKSVVKKNYPWIIETHHDKLLRLPANNFGYLGTAATNFSVATSATLKDSQVLDSGLKNNEALRGKCGSSKIVDRRPIIGLKLSPYKTYLHLNEKVNKKNHLIVDYHL